MARFSPTIHPWNQQVWQDLTAEPERSNHALLFCGDAGLGKQDLAVSLAHFVLTETHDRSETLFNAGSHPDLHVIAPEYTVVDNLIGRYAQRYLESHSGKPKQSTTIEQIRRLSQALTTHPHVSTTRVVLLLEANALNRNAANALLKNLEEPPANTLFILVSNEISLLPKTIRSRCSLIQFRTPENTVSETWLRQQAVLPDEHIATYLSVANHNPLQAIRLFEQDYITHLKSIFTGVNSLWNCSNGPTAVAKDWQAIGGTNVIDTLQKLVVDLLRLSIANKPAHTFFPVQRPWLEKVSKKLNKHQLIELSDDLNKAKQKLTTTVDELLVLESIACHFCSLSN